jgi:hypothetical protein
MWRNVVLWIFRVYPEAGSSIFFRNIHIYLQRRLQRVLINVPSTECATRVLTTVTDEKILTNFPDVEQFDENFPTQFS